MKSNRTIILGAASLACLAGLLVWGTNADASAPNSYVKLQATTPGTAQTGSLHITGTLKSSGTEAVGVESFGTNMGVYGKATNTSGEVYGARGDVNSVQGYGTYGNSLSPTGGTGAIGRSIGTNGTGVFGWAGATSGAGTGVLGQGDAVGGYGVYGWASATTGLGNGVYGRSDSGSGSGVRGVGGAYGVYGSGPTGVYGKAPGNGYGVTGESVSGYGVRGISDATGVHGTGNYGVVGQMEGSPGVYGVYSAGNSGASGTKSFRIDHPSDPLNKYLLHYCQEGPEPKNMYDGTVITDESGEATVALPDYFEEINRDPRIQLTVDDTSDDFVMVKSVGGVKNASFVIRTSKPRVKVFWEVKATRNDKWVQKYGAPVEREKPAGERGKYQHPELYGAPASMGMNYPMTKARGVSSKD